MNKLKNKTWAKVTDGLTTQYNTPIQYFDTILQCRTAKHYNGFSHLLPNNDLKNCEKTRPNRPIRCDVWIVE